MTVVLTDNVVINGGGGRLLVEKNAEEFDPFCFLLQERMRIVEELIWHLEAIYKHSIFAWYLSETPYLQRCQSIVNGDSHISRVVGLERAREDNAGVGGRTGECLRGRRDTR